MSSENIATGLADPTEDFELKEGCFAGYGMHQNGSQMGKSSANELQFIKLLSTDKYYLNNYENIAIQLVIVITVKHIIMN